MENELLPARVRDMSYLCEKSNSPKFLGFLTPSQAAVAEAVLKNAHQKYTFFGGFTEAERVILAILPEWCENPAYPIQAITFTYRKSDVLTHRDFLGSLMALGITRESVGDILVSEGRAVVFTTQEIAPFILSQLEKIGNVGVDMCMGFSEPLPSLSQKKEFSNTVSSLRLDCVVAALCNTSRKTASEIIIAGEVAVNSICCEKLVKTVCAGDRITVRHKGRFEIDSADELSKKGKIILKYSKYI